jgi:hypothetical protein
LYSFLYYSNMGAELAQLSVSSDLLLLGSGGGGLLLDVEVLGVGLDGGVVISLGLVDGDDVGLESAAAVAARSIIAKHDLDADAHDTL